MLYWAVIFLCIALLGGFLGLPGIAAVSVGIAQVLFFIFIAMFVVALIMGLVRRGRL